ncbi:MAG: transglutaminase-like cysteine peptidase [Parvibaculaceae bacterium]
MIGKSLWGIVLTLACLGTAQAAENVNVTSNYNDTGERNFATTYGETLPPVGFVEFCQREPRECQPIGGKAQRLELTDGRWKLLNQVNQMVNDKIAPLSDMELYGVAEYWAYPDAAGDCEDYVLLKKRYLEGLGVPAETLLITVVLDEVGDGHAVLMVRTDKGDFVLDNRREAILRWNDTRYQYLKRQSQQNPRNWVALTNKTPRHQPLTAGGN